MTRLVGVALIFAAAIFAKTGSVGADSEVKNYEDMTFEELRAIDPKLLPKEERRSFKKYFKKAKKRFEKEQRKRKAAEKSVSKNTRDMFDMMRKSYRLTDINEPDNNGVRTVTSKPMEFYDYEVLGSDGHMEYLIQTEADIDFGQIISSIVVKTTASEAVDDSSFTSMGTSRARRRQWIGYALSYSKNEDSLEITSANRGTISSKLRAGIVEELAVPIGLSDITAALKVGSGLDLKLFSDLSADKNINIPFAYLVGFMARIGETGFLEPEDQEFLTKLKHAIERVGQN